MIADLDHAPEAARVPAWGALEGRNPAEAITHLIAAPPLALVPVPPARKTNVVVVGALPAVQLQMKKMTGNAASRSVDNRFNKTSGNRKRYSVCTKPRKRRPIIPGRAPHLGQGHLQH